jgi:hypothetical protein
MKHDTTSYESPYSRTLRYKVHGFWPIDLVRVHQYRSIETGEWGEPDVTWSAGGRMPTEEPSDIAAAENFSKALADAIEQAKKWKP